MRTAAAIIAGLWAIGAHGQAIVKSPAPERVALTVYRDPNRGSDRLDLGWLRGVALVSETRRIVIPAGESEVRFEGVTGGIVPQSAIVTGLGEAVLEKNRDARLLSPGALLDSYLAQRVTLRRTLKSTGAVREQEAVIRATNDGVVIQTADGIEALRCTGLPETLIAPAVPADLSAKPTLSVRVRSPRTIDTAVTLSYLSDNFDWQADYVGDLSADGRTLSLFGWLTLANGDVTALKDAAAQAVAGQVNYQRVWVEQGRAKPIAIECWPQGTTSDIDGLDWYDAEGIVVTGRVAAVTPPPPPPAPSPERGGEEVMAREERLGDVRLYRIPIAVTVAPRSQKQIALLRQPTVKVDPVLRFRAWDGSFNAALERVIVTTNVAAKGLGVALPAGRIALFGEHQGHRILLGEGAVGDYTIGDKVEIKVGTAPTFRAVQRTVASEDGGGFELTVTNDSTSPQPVEIELPTSAKAQGSESLVRREGFQLWRPMVPANGAATLRYRL